jgi:hypothetical protein
MRYVPELIGKSRNNEEILYFTPTPIIDQAPNHVTFSCQITHHNKKEVKEFFSQNIVTVDNMPTKHQNNDLNRISDYQITFAVENS